ncbi:MAG: T9SS type A sorting domain-containing protein [Ignavibacteriaceae bacterium]
MRNSKISLVKILVLGFAMLMLGSGYVFAQLSVNLPNVVRVPAANTDTVDVTVGSLNGLNVTSFQFDVTFDTTICKVIGATTSGVSTTGGTNPVYNVGSGIIHIAWAKATAISGSGTLIRLVVSYMNSTGVSALSFNNFLMYSSSGALVPTTLTNGSVTIPSLRVSFNVIPNVIIGDTISIPVNVNYIKSSDSFTGYKLVATFNPVILKIIGYDLTGTLGKSGAAAINPDNTGGKVTFAWANGSAISGAGVLVNLRAVVLSKGSSPLNFTSFTVNNGTPIAYTFNGALTAITDVINYKPVVKDFNLSQNYPNPFNPTTQIQFSIPKESKVVLKVYNLLGEEVATLVNQQLASGTYTYQFDASKLSSGVYLYRITAGNYSFIKKMTLLK